MDVKKMKEIFHAFLALYNSWQYYLMMSSWRHWPCVRVSQQEKAAAAAVTAVAAVTQAHSRL